MIPFTITSAAAAHINTLLENTPGKALKIGLKKGGCAGMEYTMDILEDLPTGPVIEQEGAKVVLDPMAEMFLFGTELDYETSLLESGFVFRNPNVKDACGCGESISFNIDEMT